MSFRKAEKRRTVLTQNYEFRRAYKYGKNYVSPLVATYVLPRKQRGVRVGIAAGKKIGGAVQRNRAKRVVRAAYSRIRPQVCGGADIVFVCRTRTVSCSSDALVPVLLSHLTAAGVVK